MINSHLGMVFGRPADQTAQRISLAIFQGTLGPSTNPASFSGGLIVTAGARGEAHRELIVNLAARQRLHTIYPSRHWVSDGGRISCGTVSPAPTRRSIEAARVNLASATAAKPASTESSVFCAECCRLIEHASA
jgi:hypothetical protein